MSQVPQSSGEHQRADRKGYLPRLSPEHYRGYAIVHWTLTIEHRATSWLTERLHHIWREALLHTCVRYDLVCPAYVLMPDHIHLLLIGLNPKSSDQRVAIEFLRKTLRPVLAPAKWQKQAHDHVLREDERAHGAFQTIAHYIWANPVRAKLCPTAADYAYAGCCVPGYPELNIHADDYWMRFWRLHRHLIAKS